ncbi:MAG: hypothetical protein HQK50_04595 [Oligoflexia bacterium]|nr:hypothetical protein [Oligoflexia bacterium]MBF0364824.1 hypothetical protein [Oligoflexia bacterium]
MSNKTQEELAEELAKLKAENEELKKNARVKSSPGQISYRVSEKGGVSVYGLGRFPVTLYKEQWKRLLERAEDIKAFLKENDHLLKNKD